MQRRRTHAPYIYIYTNILCCMYVHIHVVCERGYMYVPARCTPHTQHPPPQQKPPTHPLKHPPPPKKNYTQLHVASVQKILKGVYWLYKKLPNVRPISLTPADRAPPLPSCARASSSSSPNRGSVAGGSEGEGEVPKLVVSLDCCIYIYIYILMITLPPLTYSLTHPSLLPSLIPPPLFQHPPHPLTHSLIPSSLRCAATCTGSSLTSSTCLTSTACPLPPRCTSSTGAD